MEDAGKAASEDWVLWKETPRRCGGLGVTGTPKSPPSKLSSTCTLLPEKPAWLLGLESVIVL